MFYLLRSPLHTMLLLLNWLFFFLVSLLYRGPHFKLLRVIAFHITIIWSMNTKKKSDHCRFGYCFHPTQISHTPTHKQKIRSDEITKTMLGQNKNQCVNKTTTFDWQPPRWYWWWCRCYLGSKYFQSISTSTFWYILSVWLVVFWGHRARSTGMPSQMATIKFANKDYNSFYDYSSNYGSFFLRSF